MLVPKLAHDPSGTKWMPIIGLVPAFITDQPTGASRTNPLVSTSTDNGLVVEHPNKLRAIRVFFFDIDALPSPPDGIDRQDYIGSGKKIVTLVDYPGQDAPVLVHKCVPVWPVHRPDAEGARSSVRTERLLSEEVSR